MSIKLSKIEFVAGSSISGPNLSVQSDIIILVGPNNSGKSLALREIEAISCGQPSQKKVVKNADIIFPTSYEEVIALLQKFESAPPPGNSVVVDHFWVSQHTFSEKKSERNFQVSQEQIRSAVQQNNVELLQSVISPCFITRLDGRSRFALTDEKPTGDLQLSPKNHLWALFKDDAAREKVRTLTEKAFKLHFVIDPTGMNKFRIRMSKIKPISSEQEQGLNTDSRNFHNNADEITTLSDGVQAYVGLVSALLSLEHKILLIDEPEAFLHPPLARQLGSDLVKIAKERKASLIISTHNAPFVMGCLESSGSVAIVRLTYEDSIASARVLEEDSLKKILNSALLRSTGVIQGLFHRAVIVGESDTDRAFYDEINRRLNTIDRGISDAQFINAQNCQTIHRLIAPLRVLGIPSVAIVDLDFIKHTGNNWSNLLDACRVPKAERSAMNSERDYFKRLFSSQEIKKGGEDVLNSSDKNRFNEFLNSLAKYGLFIVPKGELESWLSYLNVTGHGSEWLVNIFDAIGDTEEAKSYLQPGEDDVWHFIDKIAKWVNNPNKEGM